MEPEFSDMISYEDALACVVRHAWRLGTETVPLENCLGRILAQAAVSDIDMPPFDKSAVDGFACRSVDTSAPLQVVGVIPAGTFPERTVGAGEALKIMTGAPMPPGADCVVMKEHTEPLDGGRIRVTEAHAGKRNFCPKAEDVRLGDVVLRAGVRLTPQHLAILASVGVAQPLVSRKVRIGVFSTGTELVPPEETPGPGQIRNSNSVQIAAQAAAIGAEVRSYGAVADTEDALLETVRRASAECDVVISTGGVSVGDFDLMPEIYARFGAETHFRKVAIQPGKPIVFATQNDKAFFGLSGNPVSSFLQFTLFVAPFVGTLSGAADAHRWVSVPLAQDMKRKHTQRMQWFPVTLQPDGAAVPVDFHGSAHVHALAHADALAAYPVGVDTLAAGGCVRVLLLP